MSWFFGKKKHNKDSPPDTPNNERTSSNQIDDYIFIEKRSGLYPSINNGEGGTSSNDALYPNIPAGAPPYPVIPQNLTKQSHTDIYDIVNNIPFKLSPNLEKSLNNDLDIDTLRINEISNFIERVKSANNVYDFNVENSVITEMNSQTE